MKHLLEAHLVLGGVAGPLCVGDDCLAVLLLALSREGRASGRPHGPRKRLELSLTLQRSTNVEAGSKDWDSKPHPQRSE